MLQPISSRGGRAIVLAGALAAAFGASALAQSADPQAAPEIGVGFAPKPTVYGDKQMVAVANPLAAEAALRVLREEGTAIDAAIAALMVLNVVEPQSSGVGGGGFALYWDAESARLSSWDGRETAPLLATPDMFLQPAPAGGGGAADSFETSLEQAVDAVDSSPAAGEPIGFADAVAGGVSTGAPGLVRMLYDLHERHGELDWDDLFEDAIRIAEEGFPVSPRLAAQLAESADKLARDPEAKALFFGPDGHTLPAGALLRNPALAEVLTEIADDGPEGFYEGDIAEAIVARVAQAPRPGTLSLKDLADYRAVQRDPVCMRYRVVYEVCGMGPPSSGGVTVGMILGILDSFPIPSYGPEDARAAHAFLEASKLAYADRARYLADPDYVSQPTVGLLDPSYLLLRAQKIDPVVVSKGPAEAGNPPWREGALQFAPDPQLGRHGTTHLTIVDAQGDVISITASVETAFGSGRMVMGFLLNNQLTDFSFRPKIDGLPVANAPGPRKRPRSSMAPTIVFDTSRGERRPVLALGSPGGSRIIEYVAQTIVAVLDWKMTPGDATALPHLSQRNRDAAQVELGADGDILAADLEAKGWVVERVPMTSGVHLIAIAVDRSLAGAADPRREGVAVAD